MEIGKDNHAEPETAPETEADPLFELCVDEEVLRVSAGLEPLRVPRPVPLPDFVVEEVVGISVLTLTLVPFTCDSCSRLLLLLLLMMGLV